MPLACPSRRRMPLVVRQRSVVRASARERVEQRGFTIIELLGVLVVIAVLIGMSLGMLRAAKQRAAISRARAELAALTTALERYKSHYGDYPQTGNAGQATPVVGATIVATQAQALLLNALIGVYGPTNFATRLNGPMLVEVSKFKLEADVTT